MGRASEWKEKAREAARVETVELALPSGMVILARRPGLLQLAGWDRMPLGLAGAAAGGPAEQVSAEKAIELAAFLRDLLVYVCVDPRVSLTPGEDEIHPKDIPQQDWTYILNWAMRVEEARSLEGFRRQRADAGGGGDGEAVLDKTF